MSRSTPTTLTSTAARLLAVPVLGLAVLAGCASDPEVTSEGAGSEESESSSEETVTVYLGRHYGIEPIFERFTEETGIPVEFTAGKDPELRERLVVEGENTPADVYLAADAGNLELADRAGVLAPTASPALEEAVPAELRDSEGAWHGLSVRARTIVTSEERVADDEVPTSYAALGDEEWSGRLCLRPSTNTYTQSLVASLIANEGEDRAEEIVSSWTANDPTYIDSDVDIIEAIAAGDCDVALVNSYYLPRLEAEEGDRPVRLSWPTEGPGVHANVSGAGVTRYAPNPEGAQALIEWLATDGQEEFAAANFEFPVSPSVAPRQELVALGTFTRDPIAIERFGELQPAAVQLLDRAGYQ